MIDAKLALYILFFLNICHLLVSIYNIIVLTNEGKSNIPNIKFILHDKDSVLPKRYSRFSAGLDLSIIHDVLINPGEIKLLDTGCQLVMDNPNFFAMVCDRSSIALYKQLRIVSQIIDIDYTSSIKISIMSHSQKPQQLFKGQRVAQLLILPISYAPSKRVNAADATKITEMQKNNGNIRMGGFGSSGEF